MQLFWILKHSRWQRPEAQVTDFTVFWRIYTAYQEARADAKYDVVAWAQRYQDKPAPNTAEVVSDLSTNILQWANAGPPHTLLPDPVQRTTECSVDQADLTYQEYSLPPLSPQSLHRLGSPGFLRQGVNIFSSERADCAVPSNAMTAEPADLARDQYDLPNAHILSPARNGHDEVHNWCRSCLNEEPDIGGFTGSLQQDWNSDSQPSDSSYLQQPSAEVQAMDQDSLSDAPEGPYSPDSGSDGHMMVAAVARPLSLEALRAVMEKVSAGGATDSPAAQSLAEVGFATWIYCHKPTATIWLYMSTIYVCIDCCMQRLHDGARFPEPSCVSRLWHTLHPGPLARICVLLQNCHKIVLCLEPDKLMILYVCLCAGPGCV